MVTNIDTGVGGIQSLLLGLIELNRQRQAEDEARYERELAREDAKTEREFQRRQFMSKEEREKEQFEFNKLQAQIGSLSAQRDAELSREEPNMSLVNALNKKINQLQGIELEAIKEMKKTKFQAAWEGFKKEPVRSLFDPEYESLPDVGGVSYTPEESALIGKYGETDPNTLDAIAQTKEFDSRIASSLGAGAVSQDDPEFLAEMAKIGHPVKKKNSVGLASALGR